MIKLSVRAVLLLCLVFISNFAYSSKLKPINFQQLSERSTHIALGSVISIKDIINNKSEGIQEATIKIDQLIKGQTSEQSVKIKLRYRGLVDFDPRLTEGQSGVFFLLKTEQNWELAFPGSVALFSKINFR